MRKLMAILCSVVMIFGSGVTAYADADLDVPIEDEIVESYQYTYEIYNRLSFSNKTATCKSYVRGNSNKVTKIEITQNLYQQIGVYWYYVTGWTKTFDSWNATYTTTKSSLNSGTTYRLITTAKVYSGSDYEKITYYGKYVTC